MVCLKVSAIPMTGANTGKALFSYLRAALQPASKAPAVSAGNKRGTITDQDVANLASKKKTKTPSKCKDCFRFLKRICNDHRANSMKCPCVSKYWNLKTWSEWESYLEKTYGQHYSKETNLAQCTADGQNLQIFWEVTTGIFLCDKNEDKKPPLTKKNQDDIARWYCYLLPKANKLTMLFT